MFQTTCYLIDRIPSLVSPSKTHLEFLFNTSPDYNWLRVFGSKCYPFLRPFNNHKLCPRSFSCVFLGHSLSHKGYKCLHLPTNHIYISRHVAFNEKPFPFAQVPIRPILPHPPISSWLMARPPMLSSRPTIPSEKLSSVTSSHTIPIPSSVFPPPRNSLIHY